MEELKKYDQWIVWKYSDDTNGKATKLPISPHSGEVCAVTKSENYSTFEHCLNIYQNHNDLVAGIAFCLTENDPFCFIDIDKTQNPEYLELQKKIFAHTSSYAEISPSGQGLHIICKAKLPSGKKRYACEIYTQDRYVTVTGNVYRAAPIVDEQDVCEQLWAKLGGVTEENKTKSQLPMQLQLQSDEEVYKAAISANNAWKFYNLWVGEWSQYYDTQSEADFALVNILAFYTKNTEQIARMFRLSALGQRAKAHRVDYMRWMLDRCFDRDMPEINIDGIVKDIEQKMQVVAAEKQTLPTIATPERTPQTYPRKPIPGLVGQIASFIYDASARAIPEVAMSAAFGFVAGIVGRAYNVQGDGLNIYVCAMARTGRGKNFGVANVDKLVTQIQKISKDAIPFIGPSEIMSGSALIKSFVSQPSYCSFCGEIGKKMQQMVNPRASNAEQSQNRLLLDLYTKSSKGQRFGKTAYSKKEDSLNEILSPALTICGESNPDTFYNSFTEAQITEGLVSRFWILESDSPRLRKNKFAYQVQPSAELLGSIIDLSATAQRLNSQNEVIDVKLSAEADELLDKYDDDCDWRINNVDNVAYQNLWTRAGRQAVKIAAIVAVGMNPFAPLITRSVLEWAINEVNLSVNSVVKRVEQGDIASSDNEALQIDNLKLIIKDYMTASFASIRGYSKGVHGKQMHQDKVVTWSYMYNRARQLKAFSRSQWGVKRSLEGAINNLVLQGAIAEVSKIDLKQKYNVSVKAWGVVDVEHFL